MSEKEPEQRKTSARDSLTRDVGNSWREVYREMECDPDQHEDTENEHDG